jgi:hypothetical protein
MSVTATHAFGFAPDELGKGSDAAAALRDVRLQLGAMSPEQLERVFPAASRVPRRPAVRSRQGST